MKGLLVVGALADVVEDQFRGCSTSWGSGRSHFLPARGGGDAAGRPDTRYLLAQPFLAETAMLLEKRGATRLAAPFPLGAEGTTAWLRAAAEAFGVDPARFDASPRRAAPAPPRRWSAIARSSTASRCSSSPTASSRRRSRGS
jgi:light-independent protochlorophyllide reductase subunit N